MFEYDEETKVYSWKLDNMIISCETEPDAVKKHYGEMLKEQYEQNLNSIAEYICKEREFKEVYGRYSAKQTLKMLKCNMTIPWIFIKGSNMGTIAWCDENYVMEFEFEDCFQNFKEFQISS